ncbi:MAG: hypothetical protein IPJ87_08980 [Flavobacteriales bacterium]|nr:hypothetical protein [Flavobacteriales bacterium]MBK9700540.1 hypothetical protein [Flavobacteriales bacterium]
MVAGPPGVERFAGRELAVANMHGKEAAIGTALLKRLPFSGVIAVPDLDTDRFGAFSGEVERGTDPRTAALHKAMHGAERSGADLVIASEGSFVPYPPAPFITCAEEWLVLLDARDGTSWTHRHVTLESMAGGQACTTVDEVLAFASRMGFPEHALVLKPREHWRSGDTVVKGITDRRALQGEVDRLLAAHGGLWVESDLRAMMNPTRMAAIRTTAERFARELGTCCPQCGRCTSRSPRPGPACPAGFVDSPPAASGPTFAVARPASSSPPYPGRTAG